MSSGVATGKRQYRMRARAKATEATRLRILEAFEVAFGELPPDEMTLEAIAERADVSVQTILRHFESKNALRVASVRHAGEEMAATRNAMPIGDLDEMVDALVANYEKFGDRVLRMLRLEQDDPELGQLAELGRTLHLEWCREAFAASLKGLRGRERKRRVAQLAACTDVHVWKVLRADMGLDSSETKLAMRELLEPLMERPARRGGNGS